MNGNPGDTQGLRRPNLPNRILARIANNGCLLRLVTYPLALLLVPVTAYAILLPSVFLPHYIALPIAFALGMVPWLLPFGLHRALTKRFVIFSALIWGGLVCVVYGYELSSQNYPKIDLSSVGWEYWVGWVLLLLATILGFYYRSRDRAKKRTDQ